MATIELTEKEIEMIIGLMDTSQVAMSQAEEAAEVYKKFKEAK